MPHKRFGINEGYQHRGEGMLMDLTRLREMKINELNSH